MSKDCPNCLGMGTWEVECCNGSGGCSCQGMPVPMGTCRSCRGSGVINEQYDAGANLRAIEGACFIGTGPSQGWEGARKLGIKP